MKQEDYCSFFNQQHDKDSGFAFIEHLKFDNQMKCLVGYGKTTFLKLELETSKVSYHEVDNEQFESILDLNFTSSRSRTNLVPECQVACKKRNIN